jgi:phosphoribosylformylglycinamidine synthase
MGMTVSIEDIGRDKAAALNLFCEASARYLIAVPQSSQAEIVRRGTELSINAGWCGSVQGDHLVFIEEPVKARKVAELPLSRLRQAHEGWLPNYMNEVD